MRLRITFTMALCVLALVACARQQQQQKTAANMRAVCQSAEANPAILPILDRVTMNVKDITLAMRADKSYATDSDKPALEAWEQARKECYRAENAATQNANPQMAAINRQVEINTDALIAKLYSGQITYGEFNSKRIENVAEGGRQMAVVRQQINAQNQQNQTYRQAANCAAARAQVAQEEANGPAPGAGAAFLQGMNQQLTINNACN